MPWLFASLLAGTGGFVFTLLLASVERQTLRIAMLVGALLVLVTLLHNPRYFYRRLICLISFSWLGFTILPNLAYRTEETSIEIDWPQPSAWFHIGTALIVLALLWLDFLTQTASRRPLRKDSRMMCRSDDSPDFIAMLPSVPQWGAILGASYFILYAIHALYP